MRLANLVNLDAGAKSVVDAPDIRNLDEGWDEIADRGKSSAGVNAVGQRRATS
jgi:hypothetical protein